MKIFLSLIFCLSFIEATSFDCNGTLTNIEKEICNNATLSVLDNSLASQYAETSIIFKQNNDSYFALKDDQREWMNDRDKCIHSNLSQCLESSYQKRINELAEYSISYKKILSVKGLSGNYSWESGNSEATIHIKKISKFKYHITGEAFYGTTKKFGPNIGTINAISNLELNTFIVKIQTYKLTLKINNTMIYASENELGPFGIGVSFSGRYNKVKILQK